MKSGARRRNHWAASRGGGRSRVPHDSLRDAGRASLAGRRRSIEGLSALSPQRQAFPRISKLFQRNSKEIPSFSKLFQGFPNFFPWPFRGKPRGCRSVEPESRFLEFWVASAATGGPAKCRRTRPRFKIARTAIIAKTLSAAISLGGLGAGAASLAPARQRAPSTSWKLLFSEALTLSMARSARRLRRSKTIDRVKTSEVHASMKSTAWRATARGGAARSRKSGADRGRRNSAIRIHHRKHPETPVPRKHLSPVNR